MSNKSTPSQQHSDTIGTDANTGTVPSASQASSGHAYVLVQADNLPHSGPPRRAEELLPPPTGRDHPPAAASELEPESFERAHMGLTPLSSPCIDDDASAPPAHAGDTLIGTDSASVERGTLGRPAQGMSSKELHHDGKSHRKRLHEGSQQYGPQGGKLGKVRSNEFVE